MGYMIIISRIDGDANVFAFEDIPGLESQIEALRGARRAIDVRIAGDQEFMSAPLECPLCGDDMKVQKEERRTGFLGRQRRYGWHACCDRCRLCTGYAESESALRIAFEDWSEQIQRTIDEKGGLRRWHRM